MSDAALMKLVRTIVTADDTVVFRLLAASPALAKARFELGATRQTAETYYMDEIGHYIYADNTALHVAAAAHRQEIVLVARPTGSLFGIGWNQSSQTISVRSLGFWTWFKGHWGFASHVVC